MGADRDLNHLYPAFREKVVAVLADLKAYADKHMPGYAWIVVEGFRTAEYQHSLYEKGRTKPGSIVTNRDGVKKRSNHQSSLAVDIVPARGSSVDWEADAEHWSYLGHVARAHDLEWGGDWKKFVDKPHVEWPESDKPTYAAARKWQKENGLG